MVSYDVCNMFVADYVSGDGEPKHHLAIVEEESMSFYRLDSIEDMKMLCSVLNEKEGSDKGFENLDYSENHYTNRWYYLAFTIIYDTEFFHIYSNYANQDGTLDNEVVLKVRDFLCENSINTLSNVIDRKDEIITFLFHLVNEEEEQL